MGEFFVIKGYWVIQRMNERKPVIPLQKSLPPQHRSWQETGLSEQNNLKSPGEGDLRDGALIKQGE